VWAALHEREGSTESQSFMRRWEEQQREARQALGPSQARAAEERGAAMSLATVAEYALMLTAPGSTRGGTGAKQAHGPDLASRSPPATQAVYRRADHPLEKRAGRAETRERRRGVEFPRFRLKHD